MAWMTCIPAGQLSEALVPYRSDEGGAPAGASSTLRLLADAGGHEDLEEGSY